MKELPTGRAKCKVTVVSARPMTEEEERRFNAAIDALLAQWAKRLTSRNEGGTSHVQQDEHKGHALRGAAPQQ